MAEKASITPKILKWARESARMPEDLAAAKIHVSLEKLREWEIGESQPTIRQAESLAKIYKRPFALFFLPDIPLDFQPLQDFRKKDSKPLSTGSIFIMREIQQKQAWIKDVYQRTEEKPLSFVGRFDLNSSPLIVANDILNTLGIDPSNYKSTNPINEWIEKAELNGIFVSRTSYIHTRLKLDRDELQGFAIADNLAPFVFVNSDDWKAPQFFTLVHEIAHIWIAASGISSGAESEFKTTSGLHPVETFCNEVAANALMPKSVMRTFSHQTFDNLARVLIAAKSLGVSSFAFLLRAFNLQQISQDRYRQLKREADTEFKSFLQREEEKKLKAREQKGGPDYFRLLVNKNGQLFTQIVLDAFRSGAIEPTEASSLLNTKSNHFSKLEPFLYP